jgi:AraC family transcriptional regulator
MARRRLAAVRADQLRRLLDVLVGTLDEPISGAEIARRAHLSRFYFNHLVKTVLGESPGALRRRLLLERAAHALATSEDGVTDVAMDAGYGSLEAFTHAFRRAFGVSPTDFRARKITDFRVPAPNGLHFHPSGDRGLPGGAGGRRPMDLTDRMVEHDNWLTERLLDCAGRLTDEQLDQPVFLNPPSLAFEDEAPSIRSMLDRLVLAKEMWTASVTGRKLDSSSDTSIEGLRARVQQANASFAARVREIRGRNAWDTGFVDAIHEPPETNTFGAAVAHVLAWDAVRRDIVAGALRAYGIDPVSLDPINWEHGDVPASLPDGAADQAAASLRPARTASG